MDVRRTACIMGTILGAHVAGDQLEASGEILLTTEMFELKPPAVFGIIRVNPDVLVQFTSRWTRQP